MTRTRQDILEVRAKDRPAPHIVVGGLVFRVSEAVDLIRDLVDAVEESESRLHLLFADYDDETEVATISGALESVVTENPKHLGFRGISRLVDIVKGRQRGHELHIRHEEAVDEEDA